MSGVFGRFVNEQCVPVVLTIATAQVEECCMKNGYLFHELLSLSSCKLDNLSTRIRFERYSEARSRNCRTLEKALIKSFRPFPLENIAPSIDHIYSSPEYRPSAWTADIESIFIRCMSFSDVESLSAPIAIIYAVALNDYDPIACFEELSSAHYLPSSFKNVLIAKYSGIVIFFLGAYRSKYPQDLHARSGRIFESAYGWSGCECDGSVQSGPGEVLGSAIPTPLYQFLR